MYSALLTLKTQGGKEMQDEAVTAINSMAGIISAELI
jgi:hypothetical protein